MEIKNNLHIYTTLEQWEYLKKVIDDERDQPTGRIRSGDAVRKIIFEWIELKKNNKK